MFAYKRIKGKPILKMLKNREVEFLEPNKDLNFVKKTSVAK